ncbi:hypothetical protein [Sansalvadorimonas verongulae]|uniref:hypothetical protein n=1 Tax=Sansalvadorimonas verongulae TaxID=2172824 RepID=UPI0012BBDB6D|nr:hypothetical protein [Sansalvadorimonas verongulae]
MNAEKPIHTKKHGRKAKSLFRAGLDKLQQVLGHIHEWLDELARLVDLLFEPRLTLGS